MVGVPLDPGDSGTIQRAGVGGGRMRRVVSDLDHMGLNYWCVSNGFLMESRRIVLLFATPRAKRQRVGKGRWGGGQMEAHFWKTKWKLIGVWNCLKSSPVSVTGERLLCTAQSEHFNWHFWKHYKNMFYLENIWDIDANSLVKPWQCWRPAMTFI